MPLLTAGLTALTLAGSPGLAPFEFEAPVNVPRPALDPFTALSLSAGPGRISGPFVKVASSLVTFDRTDTLSLIGTESPIDRNELATYDTASLRLSGEVANLLNFYQTTDTANLLIAESVNLNQSGVFERPATDTLSLTVSESSNVAVRIATTDTLNMSGNDGGGTVTVSTAVLTSTDDAALSVADAAAVTIFSGSIGINLSDTASLQITETAAIQIPSRVTGIRIKAKSPRIAFRKI